MFLVLYLFCNFCVFFSVQDHCAWKQWSVPGNECRQAEGSHARMFGRRTTEMGIPELRSYKGVSEILTKRNLGFFFTPCWVYQYPTSLSVPVSQFFSIVQRSAFSLPGFYSWSPVSKTHSLYSDYGIFTQA